MSDPYKPPEESAQVELDDHPQYPPVLKMVLWDEPKEKIFKRMAVNGVTDEAAERLFSAAFKERVQTIRSEYLRKLIIGVSIIVVALGTLIFFWFGLQLIPNLIFYTIFIACFYGGWRAVDGFVGYIMAAEKSGSIADEI